MSMRIAAFLTGVNIYSVPLIPGWIDSTRRSPSHGPDVSALASRMCMES